MRRIRRPAKTIDPRRNHATASSVRLQNDHLLSPILQAVTVALKDDDLGVGHHVRATGARVPPPRSPRMATLIAVTGSRTKLQSFQ